MAEPDSIQFECIGCGTMNPASAEVCAGCGYRFRGESEAQPALDPTAPRQAGRLPRESELMVYRGPERSERTEPEPRSAGEMILNAIASFFVILFCLAVIVIGLAISVFIGFFSLCLGGRNGLAPVGIGLSILLFLGVVFGMFKLLAAFFRDTYKRR
jgi:hypothetical protein